MSDFVMRVFLAALLATVACHGSAQAFYVEGLMSGMSSATAAKILVKRGYALTQGQADDSIVTGHKQEKGQVVTAFFCDDRLVQVQTDFEPKFSRFVELVEQKRKELGVPDSARVIPAASAPKVMDNAVMFSWLDEATTIEVIYAEKELSPQVSLIHRVKSSCR